MPDEHQLRVEPVVDGGGEDLAEHLVQPHRQVADDAVQVHRQAAQPLDEADAGGEGHRAALSAGDLVDDRLRPHLLDRVDDGVRDLG